MEKKKKKKTRSRGILEFYPVENNWIEGGRGNKLITGARGRDEEAKLNGEISGVRTRDTVMYQVLLPPPPPAPLERNLFQVIDPINS